MRGHYDSLSRSFLWNKALRGPRRPPSSSSQHCEVVPLSAFRQGGLEGARASSRLGPAPASSSSAPLPACSSQEGCGPQIMRVVSGFY